MFDCFLGVCNAATTVGNPTNTKFVELVQKAFGSEGGAGTVVDARELVVKNFQCLVPTMKRLFGMSSEGTVEVSGAIACSTFVCCFIVFVGAMDFMAYCD
jgi:hypothetical protein